MAQVLRRSPRVYRVNHTVRLIAEPNGQNSGCLRLPFRQSSRASNQGFLPLTLDDYLALLDWTGRVRSDKRGAIPVQLRPIIERLGAQIMQGCGRVLGAPETV